MRSFFLFFAIVKAAFIVIQLDHVKLSVTHDVHVLDFVVFIIFYLQQCPSPRTVLTTMILKWQQFSQMVVSIFNVTTLALIYSIHLSF